MNAKKAGFDNVLYLDSHEAKYLEEVGHGIFRSIYNIIYIYYKLYIL